MDEEIIHRETVDKLVSDLNKTHDIQTRAWLIHLYVENIVNHIIKKRFPNKKKLAKLRYCDKLDLLVGLNILPEETLFKVNIIDQIRNKFAPILNIDSEDFYNELMNLITQIDLSSFINGYEKEKKNIPFGALLLMTGTHILNKVFDGYEKLPSSEISN